MTQTTPVSKRNRAADLRLRRNYHISLREHRRIFQFQNCKCAICKRPVPSNKPRLAVDHDHTSGLVRGLLCWRCNKTLAAFFDKPELFQAAADYLREPPATIVLKRPRYTAPGKIGTKRRAKLLLAMAKQLQEMNER